MKLSDQELTTVSQISEEILIALDEIAAAAQDALTPPSTAIDPFVSSVNPMTGVDRARINLAQIRDEVRRQVERVQREPFVSRVKLRWDDSTIETIYVTRGSAAGIRGNRKLASQATPMGRLSVLEPGEKGSFDARKYEILEHVDLRPERKETWDGLQNTFLVDSMRATLESLRAFLEAPEVEVPEDVLGTIFGVTDKFATIRENLRRRVIERMSLRDQPTLDRYQDEVSRLPVDHRVLLLGPPGSGKTTTLVRRLAFKRHPDGLTTDEHDALGAVKLRDAFDRPSGWVMFAPTDLLQLYLREAFAREQVPAETRNLRTWDRERRDLALNVLGILRVGSDRPGFALDEGVQLLKDESSPALAALHDAFVPFAFDSVIERVDTAFSLLMTTEDKDIRSAAETLSRRIDLKSPLTLRMISQLIDHASILQPEITRLHQETEDQIKRIANKLLSRRDSELMSELVDALPMLRGNVRSDEEDDEEEEPESESASRSAEQEAAGILLRGLRARARQVATGLGRRTSAHLSRLLEVLGSRVPSEDDLVALGRRLVLIGALRVVQRAPRRLVLGIPAAYGKFRRTNAEKWFLGDAGESIRTRRISPGEVDVVILTMLGVVRRLLDFDVRRYTVEVPDWLGVIRQRYVPQVFVDESTDFSSVQLACMLELAHPRLRSWFACGDFLQRVTAGGVQHIGELGWIAKTVGQPEGIEHRDVSVGYRQSLRLRALAAALEDLLGPAGKKTRAATLEEESDIWPLLVEHSSGDGLAKWIAARIAEIGRTVRPLPSIAVFVDGENRIDPLVDLLRPALAEQNLPVAACRSGRDIGDRQEIRVFDVQHIKGLEFEAVFFVGIDVLAARLPDLFTRFLYVGVTRAATYLAVTAESTIPSSLEPVRGSFSQAGWDS